MGYVLSFMLIGQVWLNHHAVFHSLRVVDQPVLIFNLLLLLDVAFLPFATTVLTESLEVGAEPSYRRDLLWRRHGGWWVVLQCDVACCHS